MALKPLRHPLYDDISAYMNEKAERGRVVIWDTTTTGLGDMDDANALVKVPTDSGGVPVGVLMCDVVDVDQSRYALNMHQDEVQKNSKVPLLKRGFVRTNCLVSGLSPQQGALAYFTTSGNFTTTSGGTSSEVGRFASGKDADGYAKIEINIV